MQTSFLANACSLSSLVYGLGWLILLTLPTCGSTNPDPEQPTNEERRAIEERLMLELSPSNDRAGRQRNDLINFAIDQLWDVEAAPSGYFYEILEPGEGDPLQWGDWVRLHYRGIYLDGRVFNDSRRQGGKLDLRVGAMIDAWNDVLQKLRPGASVRILVPSDLAYGADGMVSAEGDTIVYAHTPMAFELGEIEMVERAEGG